MRKELLAEYDRLGALCDKAGREYDRRYRAVAIATAIGARPVTVDALRELREQADRRFWLLCNRRHAAFNAWNDVRKAADRERG